MSVSRQVRSVSTDEEPIKAIHLHQFQSVIALPFTQVFAEAGGYFTSRSRRVRRVGQASRTQHATKIEASQKQKPPQALSFSSLGSQVLGDLPLSSSTILPPRLWWRATFPSTYEGEKNLLGGGRGGVTHQQGREEVVGWHCLTPHLTDTH